MNNNLTFDISIPCGNTKLLEEKFKRITNKCKRYKIGLPTYEKVGSPIRKKIVVEEINYQPVYEWVYFQDYKFSVPEKVSVDDIPFKIIGKFTPTEKGNLIDNYTKEDFDVSLRNKDLICEHCNTKRYRKEFYYVEKDGERKAIGRNCLQDYFGIDPKRYFQYLSWIKDLNKEFESYRNLPNSTTLIDFLCIVDYVVEVEGKFIPTSKVSEYIHSTAGLVNYIRFPQSREKKVKLIESPTQKQLDERKDKVIAIIEKARKELKPTNDWASNLKIAMDLDYVEYKTEGLVCSVYGWLAYQEKDFERKNNENKVEYSNNYFGEKSKTIWNNNRFGGYAGERYTNIKLKIVDMFPCRDFFIVKLINDNKDAITWFTNDIIDLETDDTLNVNFRVKDHSEYKGVKSTIINQVKIKN
jgi:hypothetical protein|tara:strand:+ start:77 stop:1312 length:1236 start_codon:yes stop_codon:yes gene_type:complete